MSLFLQDLLLSLSPERAHALMDRLGITHDNLRDWVGHECPCERVEVQAYLEETA